MKKKIFAIALVVCVLALSIASASMAYFTDIEEATNVFTAGNVDITLSFSTSTVDGDDTDTSNDTLEIRNEKVYPGQVFDRKATITNVGSEDAYVAAIITLTNENGQLANVITAAGDTTDNIPVAFRTFFTKLVSDGYTVKYASIANGYEIYVIKTTALAGKTDATTDAVTLFENIVIPTEWDNAEMKAFSGLKVSVKAFATQKSGFNDATTAITTAFKDRGWPTYDNFVALPNA